MRLRASRAVLASLLVVIAALAAGCGDPGSSGTEAPDKNVAGEGCAPMAGEQLVMLEDDKKLQTVDNIVPAVNQKAASNPALIATLDKVSDALDTEKLVALNKAVDIDHKTAAVAAKEFATQAKLTEGLSGGSGKIVIGTADFSENKTLGSLYEVALDAAGFDASVRQIGNRELYEPSLEKGEQIQVVPEYVGTLTEFLNKKLNGKDAQGVASGDLDKTMTALTDLGKKAGLVFGKPSQAADQNGFAVTKALADAKGLKTLSDFAEKCSGKATVLAAGAECPERPFCKPGLENTYDIQFGSFSLLDSGGPQTKTALKTGTATIGLVFTSDAVFAQS